MDVKQPGPTAELACRTEKVEIILLTTHPMTCFKVLTFAITPYSGVIQGQLVVIIDENINNQS
jgi:hypothetical protein